MTRRSLTSQALFLLGGNLFSFAFMFVLPLVLVRIFSQYDFGLYRQFFVIYYALFLIAQLGLTYSLPSIIPRDRSHTHEIIANTTFLQFVMMLLLSFCGILLYMFGSKLGLHHEIVRLAPVMGFFTGLMVASSPFDQMLIIEERTDLASILLVLWDLTRGAFLLGAALLTNDLNSALWAMTFAALLLYLAMLLYLRYRYRLTWRKISLSVFRRHVAFSSSMTVQSAAHLIESQTDKYAVMLLFCTNTYAIYSVGAFQLPIVQMVFSSITTVILPRLASLYSAGEIHRLIDLWNDAIRKSAIILFPVFALLLNVYSEFIIVLFTTNYVESIPIFVIYIWTIPTYIMANNLLLQATGHERYLFLTGLIKPILAVAIIALGIYFAGLLGAAAGLVVYQYVSKYLYAWFSARALKVPLLQLIPGRALIHISVLMLIASIPTLYFEMFVKLSPFALLFAKTAIFCSVVTMLYIFSSVLTIEDRAKIRSLVNTAISKLSRKQQTSSERDETSPRKSE